MKFTLFPRAGGATSDIEAKRWERDQFRYNHPAAVRIYHAVLALRKLLCELKAEAISGLGTIECPPGTAATMANLQSELRFKIVDLGKNVAAAESLLQIAESSDEFKTADDQYQPLLKKVEELEAAETERERQRMMAEGKLRDARAAAEQKLLAQTENDKDVVTARRELAEAQAAVVEL